MRKYLFGFLAFPVLLLAVYVLRDVFMWIRVGKAEVERRVMEHLLGNDGTYYTMYNRCKQETQ